MSNNKLTDKLKKLRKSIADKETISTYAQLFLFEYENRGKKIKPKLSEELKAQVQSIGFYLDI